MQTITGSELRRMILSAAASIEIHKQDLNELNVFPVPDGDTGTNMSMTIHAAANDLRSMEGADLYAVAKTAASATLRGARGNSGVILSLLFKGLKRGMKGHETCDGILWAQALQEGVDAAYKAVMKPAEGTILTVSRLAAAKAAAAAQEKNDVEYVQAAALEEAKIALADTVNQNPVLKKAGVVDAGGKGWTLALEAMLLALRGEDVVVPEEGAEGATREAANFSDFKTEDITFTYCTEFIIGRENKNDPEKLRAFLNSLGDSLVLVDDDEIIKVHVHTNDPGKALHEAIEYGHFITVKVENMRLQHTEKVLHEQDKKPEAPKIAAPEKPLGVVSVCAGAGLADVFMNLGVDQIISGGQTMNPSTQDILEAVNKVPAETVFVLPNNKNIIMAAEQCIPLTEKTVRVIPTRTVPQGVAALAYMDPDQSPDDLEESFKESAARVHTALVTYAARDSDYDGHIIHAGEYLALLDGKLLGSYANLPTLLKELNWAFGELEPEFLTVYYGQDVTETDANGVAESLTSCFPDADVSLVSGGQPVYYYMIAAE